MKPKWQYIIASLIALTGAIFGGIYGALAAAFAGDSWWPNEAILNTYQLAITIGGACVGSAPGAIWLLCLRQKWVLPFLCAALCALLLPIFESNLMGNNSLLGISYAGTVSFGFLVGFSFWIIARSASLRELAPSSPFHRQHCQENRIK